MEPRRVFSREYKLEAVKLMTERGLSLAQAARDQGLHENVLRKRVKKQQSDLSAGASGARPDQARGGRVEWTSQGSPEAPDRAGHPQKCCGLLRRGIDVKFGFVTKHRGAWMVRELCETPGVARSGYYGWLTRPRSQSERDDEAIGTQVRQSFLGSDYIYGARRVWHDVPADGHRCNLHRIERLMRAQALRARPRRRGLPVDTGQCSTAAIAPNVVLDRQFRASSPNQKWVADFTYLRTTEGWLYIAAMLDLYSRRAVGRSIQSEMTKQLITDSLMMAVWRRGKLDALLHHSDRGNQYTSDALQRLLGDLGVTCSMSRSGYVWDNSAMESFCSSLKTERTARKVYLSRSDSKADAFDYVERFYNPTRRHSTLGYLSPIQYEKKTRLTFSLGGVCETGSSPSASSRHTSAKPLRSSPHGQGSNYVDANPIYGLCIPCREY